MNEHPDSDRRITDRDAERIATHMVDSLFHRLEDPETVKRLTGIWGEHIDREIGKMVRRGLGLIFGAILLVISIKIESIINWINR
jgi:tetrahydromethanopterin S-methyltransferase subunit G